MGRPPRRDHPGAVHLVTNRGTAQTMLFRDDVDRRQFLGLLGQLAGRFGVHVLAFVLMGNHYHLIVRSDHGRLAEAMRHLDGTFARLFNRRHGRKGALFQGRYDARPITDESQLYRAGLYLHLNPVRAGLTQRSIDYRWSSLRTYVTGRPIIGWLRRDLVLGGSGRDYLRALAAASHEVDCLDLAIHDPGEDWWAPDVEASEAEVVSEAFRQSDEAVASAFAASVDELYVVAPGRRNVARLAGIVNAARTSDRPLTEVATRYGLRSVSGIHSSRHRLRALAAQDPQLRERLRALGLAA